MKKVITVNIKVINKITNYKSIRKMISRFDLLQNKKLIFLIMLHPDETVDR